jgi:hypothetical protein
MGAQFSLSSLLPMLKSLIAGGNTAGTAATPTGGALGPESAAGDMLASVNPAAGSLDPSTAAGSLDPSTMTSPGMGSGTPPAPVDYAKLAQYAQVMQGLTKSQEAPEQRRPETPRGGVANIRSSANPQLTPIAPAMGSKPGPSSVGAALASPEGKKLIAALAQMNAGIPAGV